MPVTGRQSRSFINQLAQSDIIKEVPLQNQIFRERDTNERNFYQSLNKSSSSLNRNHQSQIIVVDKPFGNQSNAGWNNVRVNNQTSMNQSLIENLNNCNQ